MEENRQNLHEEQEYLDNTLSLLGTEIENLKDLESNRKKSFISSGKEMWEDSVHHTLNFDRLVDMNQYLNVVSNKSVDYSNTVRQLDKYKRMLESPYFGRFDFAEEDMETEKIYIGAHNFMNQKDSTIIVYDWRAPISSIYYQYELGKASYKAPYGVINGKVDLKRQIKIKDSRLEYFFDSSIKIDDEMLQLVLSQNSSVKMRTIIETIQREQDLVIRDTDSDLLIVQGVAGSGKTSIALHRIAYLLYFGLNSGLRSQNVLVISPNAVFGRYISTVLPDLGEDNVEQFVFDEYSQNELMVKGSVESRNAFLEALIDSEISTAGLMFKGSGAFVGILNKLIAYYEKNILSFEDVYYDGRVVFNREELKNMFMDNSINLPAVKRLKRIEQIVLDKIHPLQKKKLEKIETAVQKMQGHDFEIKPFSRLLSIKQSKAFLRQLRRFTDIDYFSIYKLLVSNKKLFYKLSEGVCLPEDIEAILDKTNKSLGKGNIRYEDSVALLYLKLRLEGEDAYSNIRQVVIDEAQDYFPMQYEIFKLLFREAKFTVLGDINQTIEKDLSISIYDAVEKILNKKKSAKVFLNRSYRSSYEINYFAEKILNNERYMESFERHEEKPSIVYKENKELLWQQMIRDIMILKDEGYESFAIICKTAYEANELYNELKHKADIRLITNENDIEKGIMIIPSYAAKGLEFDVVLAYNISMENFKSKLDRKLLYITCTRALHRLLLYHTGEKSGFLYT